jgi:hypothetical protein
MARDPINELAALVSVYAAEDFLAQRKRLREARMRWIDENECPTPYQVAGKDSDGNETTFKTPFEVGKLRYPEQYDDHWKEEGQRHEDPALEKELLEGIDAIISESISDQRLTILVSEDGEQHAFLTGGDDKSPHPPIMEGEDYAEYYARVSRSYEQAAGGESGRPDTGRPGSGDDDLRGSSPVDPTRVRPPDVPGDETDRDAGTMLGGDTDAVRLGDLHSGAADANSVPPRPPGGPAALPE